MAWAVILSTLAAGVVAAGAAILASRLTNTAAERRAGIARDDLLQRDRTADLRAVADEVGVALHRLWAAYGPFMHAMHPNDASRYPERSPVGGDPDPEIWKSAFDDLSASYARLAMRLPNGHPLLSAAGLALNHAQIAWNDLVLTDPFAPSDGELRKNIYRGVGTASVKWREFNDTARELFGSQTL
jgi:hypothetical protein